MAITAEVLFVGPEYVKKYSQVNQSVEDSYLNTHILLAQDKHVQKYLGTRLFLKLKESGLVAPYTDLLDNYVRKITLWWMMVEIMPHLQVKIHNGGLVMRTAENAITISESDLIRELNLARQNAQVYTQYLITHLCNNSSLYPEYTEHQPGDIYPEKGVTANTNGMEVGSGSRRQNIDRYSWVKRP